jgi:hypothetical protein
MSVSLRLSRRYVVSGQKRKHGNKLEDEEDLKHLEEPEPAKVRENLVTDYRGQTRGCIKYEIDDSDSESPLVYKVHISNRGDN